MTIKELLNITPANTTILIGYSDNVRKLDRENEIEIAAFGPFVIEKITPTGTYELEADVLTRPVRND